MKDYSPMHCCLKSQLINSCEILYFSISVEILAYLNTIMDISCVTRLVLNIMLNSFPLDLTVQFLVRKRIRNITNATEELNSTQSVQLSYLSSFYQRVRNKFCLSETHFAV